MKRLITICLLLILCLGFGIWSSKSIATRNDTLQQEIKTVLQNDDPPTAAQIKTITEKCHKLTSGIGMVLNDDRVAAVSLQAYAAEFAAMQEDEEKVREALFLLSLSLEDLAESEKVSIQSLLSPPLPWRDFAGSFYAVL